MVKISQMGPAFWSAHPMPSRVLKASWPLLRESSSQPSREAVFRGLFYRGENSQRGKDTCPRSHSMSGPYHSWDPGLSDSRVVLGAQVSELVEKFWGRCRLSSGTRG